MQSISKKCDGKRDTLTLAPTLGLFSWVCVCVTTPHSFGQRQRRVRRLVQRQAAVPQVRAHVLDAHQPESAPAQRVWRSAAALVSALPLPWRLQEQPAPASRERPPAAPSIGAVRHRVQLALRPTARPLSSVVEVVVKAAAQSIVLGSKHSKFSSKALFCSCQERTLHQYLLDCLHFWKYY